MQLPLCALSQVIEHLDMGVPVDSTDDDQNTPLIIAAEGEELIVETLLERGAAIDKQNRNGVTGMSCRRYSAETSSRVCRGVPVSALIAAVKHEEVALVAILIAAGGTWEGELRSMHCMM